MSLTDSMCKSAKPKEKAYKIADSRGLYLKVMPNGSKYWRVKYRYETKEKTLSLGVYPFVTLAEARELCEKARKELRNNIDPAEAKRTSKRRSLYNADTTFKVVALEWLETKKEKWSDKYYSNIKHRLETDIFPFLGQNQIDKIEAIDLLSVLKKVEKRNALDLAIRCKQICGRVFRYGVQTSRCQNNPAIHLIDALKTRPTRHYASITPNEIPELLSAIEKNEARLYARTRRAIKLSMLTFVRPGELRQAMWSEFDFEKKQWIIPMERMKAKRDHIVPLSKQAIAILIDQKEETGHFNTDFVFPCQVRITKPLSDGTVRLALHKLGFKGKITAHGFRALARTTIREELDYEPDVIEAQLAHKPSGPLGAAYDRAQFLKQRKEMMQKWADYLDDIKKKLRYD